MTDPEFVQVTHDEAEMLIVMMREFYAHEGLMFDESIAMRALLGLISDKSWGEFS